MLLVTVFAASACTPSGPGHQRGPLGAWTPLPAGPRPRLGHSIVWTGSRMLTWGGQVIRGAKYRADGQVFDPANEEWSAIPEAPIHPRADQVAVWTGFRLLVWGGGVEGPNTGIRSFDDGASYDPDTGRWTPLARSPLEARSRHSGVWTGSRLLIWGGVDLGRTQVGDATFPGDVFTIPGEEEEISEEAKLLADGAAYDPATDRWKSMAEAPLSPRVGQVSVWTGHEMLVWGGATPREDAVAFGDGAAYDPETDRWRSIGAAPVQAGATFTAVWTGKQMIVWGGPEGAGAAYDPSTDRWTRLPTSPLPPLATPTSAWTGRVMLIWGAPEIQPDPARPFAEGAAYDPVGNRWTRLPRAPSAPGQGQAAVWAGTRMVVWGGFAGPGPLSGGAAFTLGTAAR
jgi:N-acetylneuraminic acid mutarotase